LLLAQNNYKSLNLLPLLTSIAGKVYANTEVKENLLYITLFKANFELILSNKLLLCLNKSYSQVLVSESLKNKNNAVFTVM
jgi:hypothetical protein|tara:strand:- start:5813 stop:6055 length:243 start_codon:yes stop_codon:yes gene_type:complete